MEDFFKQFGNQLENRAEPAFQERDWNKLQGRLASVTFSGTAAISWAWLSVPLLLLLVGTNAWWYFHSTNNQPLVTNHKSAVDTVFITQLVHYTDTVYVTKTVKVPSLFTPAVLTSSLSRQVATSKSRKLPPMDILYNDQYQQRRIGLFTDTSESKGGGFPDNQKIIVAPSNTLESLQFGKLPIYQIPEKPIQISAPAKKKSFRAYLPTIRPHSLQLGAIGGVLVASVQNQPSRRGYQSGFQAQLGLTSHFQVWVDAAYQHTHYETSVPSEVVMTTEVMPPSTDFVFRKAEVPQPSWQYSVGLNYQFLTYSRINPYVGVGYAAVQELPYEMAFEFFNEVSEVEWQFEKSIPRGEFQTGFLLLQTGVGYSFSRHWKGQLLLSHRSRRFGNRQIQWGFGSGLFYQF